MDRPRFYFTNVFNEFKTQLVELSTERKTFNKGSIIFSADQELDFCLYIEKGLTRYSVIHENGGEKILFYHGAGSLFPTYASPKLLMT